MIAGYDTHPAADALPMLGETEFAELAAGIATHGLLEPIVLHEGRILDGRNRALACERTRTPLKTVEWAGECGSPVSFVIARNLHRRHLDASQRAMVAAGLVPLFEEEARARMLAGKAPDPTANLQEGGTAAAKAAKAVNVSERSVAAAVKVAREASPSVVEQVKRGEVAVSAAVKALPKLKPLPARRTSRPPKSSPSYSVELVMPADEATKIIRALKDLGFVPSHESGEYDLQMVKRANPAKRIA